MHSAGIFERPPGQTTWKFIGENDARDMQRQWDATRFVLRWRRTIQG